MQNLSIISILNELDLIVFGCLDWFKTIFLFIYSNKLLFFGVFLPFTLFILYKLIKFIYNQFYFLGIENYEGEPEHWHVYSFKDKLILKKYGEEYLDKLYGNDDYDYDD